MQTYQDTATSKFWQFEDDVVVTETNGVYTFTATNGLVLTTPTTLVLYTGTWPVPLTLAQAQTVQINLIIAGFNASVQSAPITINGTDYQIDLSGNNAVGNFASASASQILIMRNQQWAASAPVTALQSFAVVNGALLICSTSGTTGTTAPTPPTAFGTPITDGTAEWELYGRSFDLVGGGIVTLTAQEIINAAMQIELYIHQQKAKRESLLAQIAAATTVSAVQTFTF